jgi:sarcosine oxidase subunit gamma
MSDPVTVTRAEQVGMITLRADLSADATAAAVKSAVGLVLPGTREIRTGKQGSVAWMSPDELLLLCEHDKAPALVAGLETALEGQHHLAVDVSDARALFRIEGKGAREVLAKGAPVDLAPGVFEPGEIRRTRLGQVAAAFWMTGEDAFELVCFRSVADFVETWLRTAALPGSLPEVL